MIDYVFRYDPSQHAASRAPANADEARQLLIDGNRVFSQWMATCLKGDGQVEDSQYVISFGGLGAAFLNPDDTIPLQKPFAVILGCSDARVPTEMLFGQGFNNLFVVRVAGNVIDSAVQGSIDFSIGALNQSVRTLVVLGHLHCGAVKGAIEAYLEPKKLWSSDFSSSLRSILQEIFVSVREADNALRDVWGLDARSMSGYKEALTDIATCLNSAHSAYALRQELEEMGKTSIKVFYGVFDIGTCQVCMPIHPDKDPDPEDVNLANAPTDPQEFMDLASQMAQQRKP